MRTGTLADGGAGTGIPAGNDMQTGLSRTSPPVILNFPHVILSAAKDLLSPAARQRNGEKILRRLRLLCGEDGRNRNSVIFGDMRLENDIFLPVCAWGVFPTRPERPPPALFWCGLTRHVGRLLHRQSSPAWRAIPPEGREVSFSTDKAPGSQKGPGGRFISLFYSRAAGEITPRSAGSPRTPCSRGDT